ncbi:hypothetical protein LY76DRAFT_105864 [Colletotrichum caudatum]|nr:hypothetical protein LY76DRAFT_105864 [Colletotrichum caudatum]
MAEGSKSNRESVDTFFSLQTRPRLIRGNVLVELTVTLPVRFVLSVTDGQESKNLSQQIAIGICGLFGRDARDGISRGQGSFFFRLWLGRSARQRAQWPKGRRVSGGVWACTCREKGLD